MTVGDGVPVGSAGGGSGRQRYLVGSADPALVPRVLADLRDNPRVRIDRVLDTASGVGGLVIEADPATVDYLRQVYGPALIIEPDRELGPASSD